MPNRDPDAPKKPAAAPCKPSRTIKITISADFGDNGSSAMSNSVLYNNLDSDSQREAICKTIDALDEAFLRAFLNGSPSIPVEQ